MFKMAYNTIFMFIYKPSLSIKINKNTEIIYCSLIIQDFWNQTISEFHAGKI